MLKEWPLVAFTVLGQAAVGIFVLFHLPFLARFRAPTYGWRITWLVTLALVLLLAGLAVLVSFFHLRHPLRARFALSNLRSSWLSREILFELVFMALVGAAGMAGLEPGPVRRVRRGSSSRRPRSRAVSFSRAWRSCTCCPPCRSGDGAIRPSRSS
ncbi:MAG: dimethyl sulfoxide reductase anchor subunit [Candidatus Moduliflexus flocculans]|nr:dimethyl sulfoxide reductase anchor subunit [Candidatus Moduliflexus flocculans]